jgi:hypothetical protein
VLDHALATLSLMDGLVPIVNHSLAPGHDSPGSASFPGVIDFSLALLLPQSQHASQCRSGLQGRGPWGFRRYAGGLRLRGRRR